MNVLTAFYRIFLGLKNHTLTGSCQKCILNPMKTIKKRFKILEYVNASGSVSYRVTGITRLGARIRENYADEKTAHFRETQLEGEYHAAPGSGGAMLRTTRLTDEELKVCEALLNRLKNLTDLEAAVDYWERNGKLSSVVTSPRLDEALAQFTKYLEDSNEYRDSSKNALRYYVLRFVAQTENIRICDVTCVLPMVPQASTQVVCYQSG